LENTLGDDNMIKKHMRKFIALGMIAASVIVFSPLRASANEQFSKNIIQIDYEKNLGTVVKYIKPDGNYARNEWIYDYFGQYDSNSKDFIKTWRYFGDDNINTYCWFKLNDKWYYDNGEGMVTGGFVGGGYYVGEDGAMVTNSWIKYTSKTSYKALDGWYYAGPDGKLLRNTYTPDGYWVNSQGIWK
jgi:glucan-binding YG repeat protein